MVMWLSASEKDHGGDAGQVAPEGKQHQVELQLHHGGYLLGVVGDGAGVGRLGAGAGGQGGQAFFERAHQRQVFIETPFVGRADLSLQRTELALHRVEYDFRRARRRSSFGGACPSP